MQILIMLAPKYEKVRITLLAKEKFNGDITMSDQRYMDKTSAFVPLTARKIAKIDHLSIL